MAPDDFPGIGAFGKGYDDVFRAFGSSSPRSTPETPEKGVAWAAKNVDGELYVSIEQVHELLSSNNVLPKMCAALKRHMGGQ